MCSQITLGTVARIAVSDGPPMIKSENARSSGWAYVDCADAISLGWWPICAPPWQKSSSNPA